LPLSLSAVRERPFCFHLAARAVPYTRRKAMILLTGGTGLAGTFVVRELRGRGQEVRVLARPGPASGLPPEASEVVFGDLANHASLRQAAEGVAGIVHAACASMDGRMDPDVDIEAMRVLLGTWQRGPFVFISSVDVYGWPLQNPVTEDQPLLTPYAWGKVRCEELLADAARRRGKADFSILRPPHIWGPHARCARRLLDPDRPPGSRLLQGEPVVLPGANEQEWSAFGDAWVDVRDLAWAAAECLTTPLGGAANAVSGHFVWHDLYAELIRLTGSRSRIEHRRLQEITEAELPRPGFYAQTWHYDGRRLEADLGPRPPRRRQDTLAEAVAAARP
jgi:nucleoside-diphosphate-sugar epimerase